jgi:predicted RNase H-like HicB family nuclease
MQSDGRRTLSKSKAKSQKANVKAPGVEGGSGRESERSSEDRRQLQIADLGLQIANRGRDGADGLTVRGGRLGCSVKRNKTREFSVVIEKDEDGWLVASVPALPGCHTQARSLDKLMTRVQEAIELYLEVEQPSRSQFVGVQKITVTA